jgi:UDP-hydrolysing UDP-N-acetyl-D-glucosamine 2-epimerase
MAYFHFVSHKDYAKRIIQMGEFPRRVHTVGALGLEGISRLKLLSRKELEKQLGFKILNRTALVTFHPVTMERNAASGQIQSLLQAIKLCGLNAIFTMPNSDAENKVITSAISEYVLDNPESARFVISLGQLKYLSLLQYVDLMIGNSSSGLIETIPFKLPVVNIGNRQKGRIKPENVLDSGYDKESICSAVRKVFSASFKKRICRLKNPFGGKFVASRIKNRLKNEDLSNSIKGFYDLSTLKCQK